jgi:hypothetical protein
MTAQSVCAPDKKVTTSPSDAAVAGNTAARTALVRALVAAIVAEIWREVPAAGDRAHE